MDAVSRADAVLKAVAQGVIRQGKRTKRTSVKTNAQRWQRHCQVVKKRIAHELRDVANERLYTMCHTAIRKDGGTLSLDPKVDAQTLVNLKPTQKHPSPDLACFASQFHWQSPLRHASH